MLDRYLTMLKALPLEHLNQSVQNVVLCCFIALSVTLESTTPKNEQQKMTALKMLHEDLLLGMYYTCT